MSRLPNYYSGDIHVIGDIISVADGLGNNHTIASSSLSSGDRISDIENEIVQMHILLNKLCPGTYGAIGGLTVAERFEEFLKTGPEWVSVKKEENK
jgi:hypothetical protein